jgi:hypothetical protein
MSVKRNRDRSIGVERSGKVGFLALDGLFELIDRRDRFLDARPPDAAFFPCVDLVCSDVEGSSNPLFDPTKRRESPAHATIPLDQLR